MEVFATKKKSLVIYSLICLGLILISLFFLFLKLYEIPVILTIGSIFSFLYLIIIFYFGGNKDNQTLKSYGTVGIFTVVRSLTQVIGLALSTVFLYFAPSLVFIDNNYKFKFLLLGLNLIPYFLCILIYYLNVKGEENGK